MGLVDASNVCLVAESHYNSGNEDPVDSIDAAIMEDMMILHLMLTSNDIAPVRILSTLQTLKKTSRHDSQLFRVLSQHSISDFRGLNSEFDFLIKCLERTVEKEKECEKLKKELEVERKKTSTQSTKNYLSLEILRQVNVRLESQLAELNRRHVCKVEEAEKLKTELESINTDKDHNAELLLSVYQAQMDKARIPELQEQQKDEKLVAAMEKMEAMEAENRKLIEEVAQLKMMKAEQSEPSSDIEGWEKVEKEEVEEADI